MPTGLHNAYSEIVPDLRNMQQAGIGPEIGGVGEPCAVSTRSTKAHRSYHCKPLTRERLAIFFARVSVQPSGCWLYAALNGKGYGVYGGEMAHRVTYEWFVGPIEEGLHIDHLCFVKACVNPAHLEAVTLVENNRRSNVWVRTGRCFNGHTLTPENIYHYRSGARGPQRTCRTCRLKSRQRWINRARIGAQPTSHRLWKAS